jgi:hypothetical protein
MDNNSTNSDIKRKKSFEISIMKKKPRKNNIITEKPNEKNYTGKKIYFIDEIDKTKKLEEIIDIESYKIYNIDVSEKKENNTCYCIIF